MGSNQGSFIQAPVERNPPIDLRSKTIIVTGANGGLGFECARQMLTAKASKVILACRTLSKGEEACRKLLADPAVDQDVSEVQVMEVDLESYTSVLDFAKKVKAEIPLLHILLLNAGIGTFTYEKSPATGHEKISQVNHLSNALLTLELLPLLDSTATKEGHPTKITWVGSRSHETNIDLPSTLAPTASVLARADEKAKFSARSQYANSKLFCVMFITELAQRISRDKVIINSVCPGMVKTNIANNSPIYVRIIVMVLHAIRARTTEQGAWIIVHAAAVAGRETHGKYLRDKEVIEYDCYLGTSAQKPAYLATEAGKMAQKKCWEETMSEMAKVDGTVGSRF